MLLNALNQNFVISIPYNWIYPDVALNWKPVLDRLYLNYNTCEDFINSLITAINFPGVNAPGVEQNIQLYSVTKRNGKQLDLLVQKQLTLTIKTTESYISYFLMRNQFDRFLKLKDVTPLYLPPITVSLLNDGGFETVSYVYKEVTMTGISALNLSYAATVGNFNTYTAEFMYNYYDVYMMNSEGKRVLVATDLQPQSDFDKEFLDSDSEKYKSRQGVAKPISTKKNLASAVKEVGTMNVQSEKVVECVNSQSSVRSNKKVLSTAENGVVLKSMSRNIDNRSVLSSVVRK